MLKNTKLRKILKPGDIFLIHWSKSPTFLSVFHSLNYIFNAIFLTKLFYIIKPITKFIQKLKLPNNNNNNTTPQKISWKRRKDYKSTAHRRLWCHWLMEHDRGSRSRSPLHKDNLTLAKMESVCAEGHISTLPQCLLSLCLPSPPAP